MEDQDSPSPILKDDTRVVAVVDDDRSVLKSLARTLRLAGYKVGAFESARDFLASLLTLRPHCLLLDVHMPEMTGLELQEHLSTQGVCLPAVFMTAYDTPQTRAQARRLGAFGLLLKPFTNPVLLRSIEEALKSQGKVPGPVKEQE